MSKKNTRQKLPADPQADMLQRFQPLLSAAQYAQLIAELENPMPPALRWNPLKIRPENSFPDWVERYAWQYKPVPYCPNGYWITSAPSPISKTVEHSQGHYYIQDAASMLPVELFRFDALDAPLILDMAASPGGKSNHLVSRTMDRGLIIANDSSRDRLTALRLVLQNWGAAHTAITNYPGEYFGAWYPETFDAVLLDAPCSMQGLRETEAHAIKPVTDKEINALARRQVQLLRSAIQALKVGGQVVYSTCTLTIEENEGVLDAVLRHFGAAIAIEPIDDILKTPAAGLQTVGEIEFNVQVRSAVRLWPFVFGTAGFFAARIRKLSAVGAKNKPPPSRPLAQAGWFPLEPAASQRLKQSLLRNYGIQLDLILTDNSLAIWRYKDNLHLFPVRFLEQFANLPVHSLGLPLGEWAADVFIPAYEFVTRFGHLASQGMIQLSHGQAQQWMRGEDLSFPPPAGSESGTYIVKDAVQRITGVGRFSGGRLRNLLPRRILIP